MEACCRTASVWPLQPNTVVTNYSQVSPKGSVCLVQESLGWAQWMLNKYKTFSRSCRYMVNNAAVQFSCNIDNVKAPGATKIPSSNTNTGPWQLLYGLKLSLTLWIIMENVSKTGSSVLFYTQTRFSKPHCLPFWTFKTHKGLYIWVMYWKVVGSWPQWRFHYN